MGPMILLIGVGVVLVVIIVANLMNHAGGHVAAMRRLAGRFPSQLAAMDSRAGRGTMVLQELLDEDPLGPDPRRPTRIPRPYIVNVRMRFDDAYLHLALDAGPIGPKAGASIPWAAISMRTRETPKHWGEIAALEAGGFLLALPAHIVEPYLTEAGVRGAGDDVVDVEYREVVEPDRDR